MASWYSVQRYTAFRGRDLVVDSILGGMLNSSIDSGTKYRMQNPTFYLEREKDVVARASQLSINIS